MNTLKTTRTNKPLKNKIHTDSTAVMIFALMMVTAIPVTAILVLAALFFGLPWAWVGGGLITVVALFIGTLVSAAIAVTRRL